MPYPLNQGGDAEIGFCAAHVIACAVFFLFLLSGFVFVPCGSLAPRHLCSRGGARGKAPFCSVFVNAFLCPVMPKPGKEFCCRLSVCLCSVWLALVFQLVSAALHLLSCFVLLPCSWWCFFVRLVCGSASFPPSSSYLLCLFSLAWLPVCSFARSSSVSPPGGICSRFFFLSAVCPLWLLSVPLRVSANRKTKKKTTEDARAETKSKAKTKQEPKQLKRNRPHTGINRVLS